MDGFLQSLAQDFASADSLNSLTFVFPNRRAGLFFRKYLGQQLQQPLWSPQIRTIDECFHELSDLKVVDQLTLLVRLYNIYSALTPNHNESFGSWLKWGQMMLADFSEIDNHLVSNVKELFTTINDLHEIDYSFDYLNDIQKEAIRRFWGEVNNGISRGNKDIHLRFVNTWSKLYPCYSQLRQSLLTDSLAYEGLLHREVIEHWEDIPAERLHNHYVFIGFNALTRSEEELMLRLKTIGRAEFYFDYEHPLLRDPENRASLFVKHNQELFDIQIKPYDPLQTISFPEMTKISIPSDVGETMQVNRLLNSIAEQSPSIDWTRTAVVLPDEGLLLPMLNTLPKAVDKVNVTMGYPLKATPEYLPLNCDASSYNSVKEVISTLRQQWDEMQNDYNSETIFSFQSTLNRVEDVLLKDQQLSKQLQPHDILYVLRMLTDGMSVSYVGEPLNGLQIMGVLETRALDFDNLIITGFNDELYPGKSHGNSYIPYTLRRGFGLPIPERQDAIFAYNFYRMLSHAKKVWFITNSQADEQHSGEVSRYLQQIVYQYHQQPKEETVLLNINTTDTTDSNITAPAAVQPDKDATLRLSPSSMNDFLSCQQRYYYKHVLHLKEPDTTENDEVDDKTLGTAFHAVAQRLYSNAEPMFDKQRIEQLKKSLKDNWDNLPELDTVRKDPIALAVIRYFVELLLDIDAVQGGFKRIGLEQTVKHTISVENKKVTIDGTIDRIDEKDGCVRLIDYKTGSSEFVYDDMSQAFETDKYKQVLQTMTYCYLYRRSSFLNRPQLPVAPYIFALRTIDSAATYNGKVHPKSDKDALFVYTDEIDNEVEKLLKDLISRIIHTIDNGSYTLTDNLRSCSYCPFTRLCGR